MADIPMDKFAHLGTPVIAMYFNELGAAVLHQESSWVWIFPDDGFQFPDYQIYHISPSIPTFRGIWWQTSILVRYLIEMWLK